MVEASKTDEDRARAYNLLGEAYARLLEFDKAVEAYEAAHSVITTFFTVILSDSFELNPAEANLWEKIGQTLVVTHQYAKAIQYFENTLASQPNNQKLAIDLAELYTFYDRFDDVTNKVIQDQYF